MKINLTEQVSSTDSKKNEAANETFSTPINISDIISVCKDYNKLGWNIQNQMETIMEAGIKESINNGIISVSALPFIKDFLQGICENPYFGEATDQAYECIMMIELFEYEHPALFKTISN